MPSRKGPRTNVVGEGHLYQLQRRQGIHLRLARLHRVCLQLVVVLSSRSLHFPPRGPQDGELRLARLGESDQRDQVLGCQRLAEGKERSRDCLAVHPVLFCIGGGARHHALSVGDEQLRANARGGNASQILDPHGLLLVHLFQIELVQRNEVLPVAEPLGPKAHVQLLNDVGAVGSCREVHDLSLHAGSRLRRAFLLERFQLRFHRARKVLDGKARSGGNLQVHFVAPAIHVPPSRLELRLDVLLAIRHHHDPLAALRHDEHRPLVLQSHVGIRLIRPQPVRTLLQVEPHHVEDHLEAFVPDHVISQRLQRVCQAAGVVLEAAAEVRE
mmetsp:Transcript_286/g.1170  ORF Transcript_286/g.1170 Transcript_286/m.1170 type:complete len:328 (-) Transcript_286:388-1371(-)